MDGRKFYAAGYVHGVFPIALLSSTTSMALLRKCRADYTLYSIVTETVLLLPCLDYRLDYLAWTRTRTLPMHDVYWGLAYLVPCHC